MQTVPTSSGSPLQAKRAAAVAVELCRDAAAATLLQLDGDGITVEPPSLFLDFYRPLAPPVDDLILF